MLKNNISDDSDKSNKSKDMNKKYFFKKTLAVMLAGLALSGCSTGKVLKSKAPQLGSENEMVIQPLDKPIERIIVAETIEQESLPENIYVLNQNKSLEIDISEYGYSRFFIEDEKITDVFVYPQDGVLAKINEPGYLIIVPNQSQELEESDDSFDSTVYITITGDNGTTQDFSLRFTGKSPEPVKFIKSILGTVNANKKGD
jgi:hypothetical protein